MSENNKHIDMKFLVKMARKIRIEAIETINTAQCGHPGGSMSQADILTALFFKVMNVDPEKPDWNHRDRFVLSKGHCTPGYYSTLMHRGYFSRDVLKTYDKLGSKLQGHPDMNKTPGVDMTSGSLGQGISAAIGMALGCAAKGDKFFSYVLLGDGECQEGQVWEAAMYAGNNSVKRIVAIVDYNKVQLSCNTREASDLEPFADKWRAFKWQVLECDGHNMPELVKTLEEARKLSASKGPAVVIAHTIKGKGISFMEGKWQWHGKTPNKDEYEQAIKELNSGSQEDDSI